MWHCFAKLKKRFPWSEKADVVVQFYPWFNFYFPLFLCLVVYNTDTCAFSANMLHACIYVLVYASLTCSVAFFLSVRFVRTKVQCFDNVKLIF